MKVLITGGAGFLGSNLARRFLKQGASVILCDNLSRRGAELNYEKLKNDFPFIKNYEVEINDVPSVLVKEKPDIVYHFAAQVAVTKSVISPVSDFKINAEGTFNVARTCHELGIPLVYTSTNKVFGENVNNVPLKELETRYDFDGELAGKGIHEEFPVDSKKHTPYGASKLVGDIYVREYGGVVNRCSCMYGENQYGIIDQGWVSYFIRQKHLGEETTIFGDGKQIRDLVYIDDVLDLLILEGQALISGEPDIKGEVFNVGGGHDKTVSLLELCQKLDINPGFADWRPSDQKVFYCDISKAKKVLGWEPKVSVDEGIAKLKAWTEQNIFKEQ
ncbi:nucleoside-diphosphate sugar epimerase [Candidatus Pacearchaeota archaeon]|nr:nucleoside-diphosphate sugar epimerase [Candidatus Pacearchaeota archaeon]|tara:strand:+ start:2063 stop:3058 length:996 start_codon:yes stop_codon:yes gene_type:complete